MVCRRPRTRRDHRETRDLSPLQPSTRLCGEADMGVCRIYQIRQTFKPNMQFGYAGRSRRTSHSTLGHFQA